MPRRISDVIGTTRQALEEQGALDGFSDIDAQFHFDPHLLRSTTIPEFSNSRLRLEEHFTSVIRLLDAHKFKGDLLYRQAVKMLTFPELPAIKLGYCTGGGYGKGIGPGLATRITETAAEIVSAGIKDPVLFELVGLFEEDIGADRISDMTVHIILPDILRFSERVARNLMVPTKHFTYMSDGYDLPFDPTTRKVIGLAPREFLRNLPVALDFSEIDFVSAYNQQLRNRVNAFIGDTWRKAGGKRALRQSLLENPERIKGLINVYVGKTNQQYDFKGDPAGEFIWADIAEKFAKDYPLRLDIAGRKAPPILEVVDAICNKFKQLVELNGLSRLLYTDARRPRHERFAQLLFFGIADAYCAANNLDVSREPSAGNGPVDFKISGGYFARVNVEVKYSSNPKLIRGYTAQLPAYDQAEKACHSIYLVIRTTTSDNSIKRLLDLQEDHKKCGKTAPDIILVDGRLRLSASRL